MQRRWSRAVSDYRRCAPYCRRTGPARTRSSLGCWRRSTTRRSSPLSPLMLVRSLARQDRRKRASPSFRPSGTARSSAPMTPTLQGAQHHRASSTSSSSSASLLHATTSCSPTLGFVKLAAIVEFNVHPKERNNVILGKTSMATRWSVSFGVGSECRSARQPSELSERGGVKLKSRFTGTAAIGPVNPPQ
jgi:hypothetical protein